MPAQSSSSSNYHGSATGYGQTDASGHQQYFNPSSLGSYGAQAGYGHSQYGTGYGQYGHQQHHLSPAQAGQYGHVAYGTTGPMAAGTHSDQYSHHPHYLNQHSGHHAGAAVPGYASHYGVAPSIPNPGQVVGVPGSTTAYPASATDARGYDRSAAAADTTAAAGAARPAGTGKSRKKKEEAAKPSKPPVLRSHLKPPKQAPSAWQVYFTEELQKMKATQPEERLNVAHVAKDAGQRYAALPDEIKKDYQRKSLIAKAEWEKDMERWRQTLTPEDIKQENMYRTAQRKAGKSRKGNLKDPHAPKKPLSAYFLFLRAIRADAKLTQQVFEGETETTKQSVLAAAKWRALPEKEKAPYLERAEADKANYEKQRREYELNNGLQPSSGRSSGGKRRGKRAQSDDSEDAAAAAAMAHVPEPPAAGVDFSKIDGFETFGQAPLGDAFSKHDEL